MKSISTGRVISKDGTSIAFDRLGQGEAVIFVCPALADRSTFLPLAQLMARGFTVFSYDRRGRGDSGDASAYAVDREIEDLETIINEAGGTASVFGGSSGAVLALEAASHEIGIAKLALYEPPFVLDDSRSAVPGDSLDQLRKMLASGRRGDRFHQGAHAGDRRRSKSRMDASGSACRRTGNPRRAASHA